VLTYLVRTWEDLVNTLEPLFGRQEVRQTARLYLEWVRDGKIAKDARGKKHEAARRKRQRFLSSAQWDADALATFNAQEVLSELDAAPLSVVVFSASFDENCSIVWLALYAPENQFDGFATVTDCEFFEDGMTFEKAVTRLTDRLPFRVPPGFLITRPMVHQGVTFKDYKVFSIRELPNKTPRETALGAVRISRKTMCDFIPHLKMVDARLSLSAKRRHALLVLVTEEFRARKKLQMKIEKDQLEIKQLEFKLNEDLLRLFP
jgi:hypothetical protein